MTQDERNLLMKDLSTRLPYGVKLGFYAEATKQTYTCTLLGLEPQDEKPVIAKTDCGNFCVLADHVKPYLFPMASMTEEQREKYESLCETSYTRHYECGPIVYNTKFHDTVESIDYLIENHFDYRGLIPMDLALDATGLNIY